MRSFYLNSKPCTTDSPDEMNRSRRGSKTYLSKGIPVVHPVKTVGWLPVICLLVALVLSQPTIAQQYTADFTSAPTLIQYPGVPSWLQTAEVTLGGTVYQFINSGNGGWQHATTGGNSGGNLVYSTAATSTVTIQRKDGAKFGFYGVWAKYTNFTNGYTAPWLLVAYNGSSPAEASETFGANTTVTLAKNLAVTSVVLTFSGLNTLNFDDVIVGPAPATIATVSNSSINQFSTTTALVGGNVSTDGGASVTERGIVYNTTGLPTLADTKVANGSGTGTFSQTLTGLASGTTYYVRAYATNSLGTAYATSAATFTTAGNFNLAQTHYFNSSWVTTATQPSPFTKYVEGWNITATSTVAGSNVSVLRIAGSSTSTSSPAEGVASARAASAITTADLASLGVKASNGSAFDLQSFQFRYATRTANTSFGTITVTGYKAGSAVAGAVASKTGVSPNTTTNLGYTTFDLSANTTFNDIDEFRITASGSANSAQLLNIDLDVVTVQDVPVTTTVATVTTTAASTIGAVSATLGGTVTASGGASVTERGIVYNTTGTPTTADTKVVIGSGTGAFSQLVGSLNSNTTYYLRAYAINSVGTAYGTTTPFTTAKQDQTITFAALADKTYGDAPFALPASASSGLAITYTSSNPAVATVSGSTLTMLAAGATTISASQAGNATYNAATPADQPLTVNKASQIITFTALATKMYGDAAFSVNASASSGIVVSYSSSNPSVATVSGNTVTITGVGSATITASQSGSENYLMAPDLQQTLIVNKAAQVISFAALPDRTYGDAAFTLSATAASGLPVSFSIVSGPASLSGNSLSLTGAGQVVVRASQAGNANYSAATAVERSFTVAKASQTLTFSVLAAKTYGDAAFTLSATSSAGLPISYSSSNASVATIAGNTVSIVGAGLTTITASQGGDANYLVATDVDQSLLVGQGSQTITFPALSDKTSSDAPFALSATASSGLPVSFSIVSGPATLSGNILSLTGAGSLTVRALQVGNTHYNAATGVERSFTVLASGPYVWNGTGTWGTGANWTTSNAPTSTSDATISSGTVTISGAATVQNLTLNAGTTIHVPVGQTLIIYGNVINNGGTLTGGGTVRFAKAGTQTLTGALSLRGVVEIVSGSTLATNNHLTLESGAILLHGTGTPNGGGNVTGNVKTKRVGKTGFAYNGWSSSVTASASSVLGATRYGYDETKPMANYARWISTPSLLVPGKGYLAAGAGTPTFTGILNNGTLTVPVTYTASHPVVADRGFNLVGNPYPGPIDYASFIAANAGIITGTLYFWDHRPATNATSNTDFCVKTGAGVVAGPHSGTLADDMISAQQGFFVEAISAGTVTFTNAMRVGSNNTKFFRVAAQPMPRIKLSVSNQSHYNETLVALVEDATDGVDALYDGRKLQSASSLSFYSKLGQENYAIQALPVQRQVVNLGMDVSQAGTYCIQVPMLENMEDFSLWLTDQKTGKKYLLTQESSISVQLEAGSNQDRFRLRVGSLEEATFAQVTIFSAGKAIHVRFTDGNPQPVAGKLFTLMGHQVEEFGTQTRKTEEVIWESNAALNQMYLLKVETHQGVFFKKLYLGEY